jgi:hypothetical protein
MYAMPRHPIVIISFRPLSCQFIPSHPLPARRSRLSVGLDKLIATGEEVAVMQVMAPPPQT